MKNKTNASAQTSTLVSLKQDFPEWRNIYSTTELMELGRFNQERSCNSWRRMRTRGWRRFGFILPMNGSVWLNSAPCFQHRRRKSEMAQPEKKGFPKIQHP